MLLQRYQQNGLLQLPCLSYTITLPSHSSLSVDPSTVHPPHRRLRSRSAGVKVGSETQADIAFLTFTGLTVEASRGLALQLR